MLRRFREEVAYDWERRGARRERGAVEEVGAPATVREEDEGNADDRDE